LPDLTVNHDYSQTGLIEITIGFADFFQTTDAAKCPITHCTLLESDCTNPYLGDTAKFQMSSTSPFELLAVRNEFYSFSYTVCLKCGTPFTGEVVGNPWTYTQNRFWLKSITQGEQL
jgi:hypothetical protein